MNVVTKAQLLGQDEVQAGEDIGECFLQGQCHGHTTDTQSGEDGGDGNAVILEHDQNAHGVDDAVDDGVQKRGLGHCLLGALDLHIDDPVDSTGDNPGDGEDNHRKENIGKNSCQRFDDVDRVDNPVKADHKTEGDGDTLERMDEDVLPSGFLHRQMAHDTAMNHAVQGYADRQGHE